MSPAARLQFHQTKSGPLMTGLETWMKVQLADHKIEPNSRLGDAIHYMLKHWSELTLFLREPGSPLDNNLCYAATGIAEIMPRPGLCRVGRTLCGCAVLFDVADAA